MADTPKQRPDTILTHAGLKPRDFQGFVNPPVFHGSTVTFPDVDTMLSGKQTYTYGRHGSPTTTALIEAIVAIEGAAGAVLCPSGLSACTTAILAVAGMGDHVLVTDSVYGPTRNFLNTMGKRFGIEATYYDPLIGAGIRDLIRPNTKAVYVETPGSHTFEMQDLPAIAAAAHEAGAFVIVDNTWATPVFFSPLQHGADISLMAATKYVVGHSDAMLGTVAANERALKPLKDAFVQLGLSVGPDDVYLGLRGLRTMGTRLRQHEASALQIARWLETRPEVARVLHPALPSHPGNDLFRRDFCGSSGLFSIVTREAPIGAVKAMLDGLKYFGLGYSWGGFESLAVVSDPRRIRTATTWTDPGHVVRLHIGLEDPADLVADLEAGLERFNAAAG
ncbi:cystathionine beta-lyase [Chthonobacter albigriseus]|uniref:cystathionine beta-lyase n=1 Tax=Chthonobacter albigriseus TaxID=1683161 RepID=UPI0015EE627D|nr:cystathionine beta-lyase [Chthonobacter albigriseus]